MPNASPWLVVPILFLAAPAIAGTLVNGGFETGDFSGWRTIGSTAIVDSSIGSAPPQGLYQALISNGKGSVSNMGPSALGNFLGVNSGLGNTGMSGSGVLTTITAQAGDVLSFDWTFLTDEFQASWPGSYPDYAVLVVDGVSTPLIQLPMFRGLHGLLGGIPAGFHSSASGFADETNLQSASYQFTQDGTHTIGIGVLNAYDDSADSGILIDDFHFQASQEAVLAVVPLPTGLCAGSALLGCLLSIHLLRRRLAIQD